MQLEDLSAAAANRERIALQHQKEDYGRALMHKRVRQPHQHGEIGRLVPIKGWHSEDYTFGGQHGVKR